MANGIYELGTKLAFDYKKTDGTISPRVGFVVPPVKSQTQSKVYFLETPEGTKSFSFERIVGNIQVLS